MAHLTTIMCISVLSKEHKLFIYIHSHKRHQNHLPCFSLTLNATWCVSFLLLLIYLLNFLTPSSGGDPAWFIYFRWLTRETVLALEDKQKTWRIIIPRPSLSTMVHIHDDAAEVYKPWNKLSNWVKAVVHVLKLYQVIFPVFFLVLL